MSIIKVVIILSTSDENISITKDRLNTTHLSLVKKYLDSLKLHNKPHDISTLFSRKILRLITEEDELFYLF